MKIEFQKSRAEGVFTPPPSKSLLHRGIICAGLSSGVSRINNVSFSDDINATISCIKALGASVTKDSNSLIIKGIDKPITKKSVILNCNESASTLRFFISICLALGIEAEFVGSKSLFCRPLSVYEYICNEQNIPFILSETNLKIGTFGKALTSGTYLIPSDISSQFASGLLFALPLLKEKSTVVIKEPAKSLPYIDLTIQTMKAFGVNILKEENAYLIGDDCEYKPYEFTVEGDFSNSAPFEALNLLGGNVNIKGLPENSFQGDKAFFKYFDMIKTECPEIDLSDTPDLAPILFVLSACFNGGKFNSTKRLETKESNRVWAMTKELEKFGISSTTGEDFVIIHKSKIQKPSEVILGHNDHRIVMALSILLSVTGGVIDGTEVVNKSMPEFFENLKKLGIKMKSLR